MQRGTLALFRDVFQDTAPVMQVSKTGRSAALHSKRNECLVARYYYYGKFTDKRYDAILNILQDEFFLSSEITLPRVLQENYETLMRLKAEAPAVGYFKKKWPHLVW